MQDNINRLLENDSDDDNAIVMVLATDLHPALQTSEQVCCYCIVKVTCFGREYFNAKLKPMKKCQVRDVFYSIHPKRDE